MKKLFFLLLFSILIFSTNYSLASLQHYQILLKVSQDKIEKCDVAVLGGENDSLKYQYISGDYRLDFISFEDEILEQVYFNESAEPLLIETPYYSNVREIKIYNKDEKEIYHNDLAYFSNVCGDGNCQNHESYEICPEDCLSGEKDDYCDELKDNKCDPDCLGKNLDIDCENLKKTEKNISQNIKIFNIQILIFVIIIIVGIIIMLLIYYFLIRKKSNQKE